MPHRFRHRPGVGGVCRIAAWLLLAAGLAAVSAGPTQAQGAAWSLSKTASPTTFTGAGEVITYTYTIANSSGLTGLLLDLSDDKATVLDCPSGTLVPPTGLTCQGAYTTTAADVAAGSVINTAVVIGDTCRDGCDVTISAQATITFLALPSWTLAKTADPTTYAAPGETIAYSYLLTNTGNVAISAITVGDDRVATVSCPAAVLAAGASMTCTAAYVTTQADVDAGSVTNTATASGVPASGTLPDLTAQATVTLVTIGVAPGSITIVEIAVNGDETFGFASTVAGAAAFNLTTASGGASRSFPALPSGTYVVTQIGRPLNWVLSALTCAGDTGGSTTTVELAAGRASIGLDAGETIVCTFTNSFDLDRHLTTTKGVIGRFLGRRAGLLVSEEPDRPRFLRRVPGSLWDTGGSRASNVLPFTVTGDTAGPDSRLVIATSLSQMARASARAPADEEAEQAALSMRLFGHEPRQAADEAGTAAALALAQSTHAPQPGFDVWVEAHYLTYGSNLANIATDGQFGILYVGADYLFGDAFIAGFLVQFDWAEETSATLNSRIEGSGTMAGPYVSARLAPNLFFDARVAWGTSDNRVDPFGLYTNSFSTERWLAHAKLTGNWHSGDDVRVTPSLSVDYVREQRDGYVDSLGVTIPAQTVELGRLTFGPEIARRFVAADGATYEPFVALTGSWDFARSQDLSLTGQPASADAFHGKVQAGLLARMPNGVSLRVAGSYDGIGSSDFDAYGGQFWLNIPLY